MCVWDVEEELPSRWVWVWCKYNTKQQWAQPLKEIVPSCSNKINNNECPSKVCSCRGEKPVLCPNFPLKVFVHTLCTLPENGRQILPTDSAIQTKRLFLSNKEWWWIQMNNKPKWKRCENIWTAELKKENQINLDVAWVTTTSHKCHTLCLSVIK